MKFINKSDLLKFNAVGINMDKLIIMDDTNIFQNKMKMEITIQEKAIELLIRTANQVPLPNQPELAKLIAKDLAVMICDEIIVELPAFIDGKVNNRLHFWNSVRTNVYNIG